MKDGEFLLHLASPTLIALEKPFHNDTVEGDFKVFKCMQLHTHHQMWPWLGAAGRPSKHCAQPHMHLQTISLP
jgi:hypothetical protein